MVAAAVAEATDPEVIFNNRSYVAEACFTRKALASSLA